MYALFVKLNPPKPEDGSDVPLEKLYRFNGCTRQLPYHKEVMHVYLPVQEDVYVLLINNPRSARNYFGAVKEYEENVASGSVVGTQSGLPDAPIREIAPVAMIPDPEKTNSLRIVLLRTADVADVLVRVTETTIQRIQHDVLRVAPPVVLFGLRNDDVLEPTFEVTLTHKKDTVTLKPEQLRNVQVWLRNPKSGFSYALAR